MSDYDGDSNFAISDSEEPKLFNQSDLNDLVRELNLSKDGAQLLASRLKERHMLHPI